MTRHLSRRTFVAAAIAVPLLARPSLTTATTAPSYGLPIGFPDRVPGDGFIIRHGYACENTWYNPGWLHTGEDWYAIEGDSAGANVYAVADGEVVFAGSEYPGRVVIVRHAPDLYSMYGHLNHDLPVDTGAHVTRGDLLGTVYPRTDGRAPSHLHFEIRDFLMTPEVNGNAPRYALGCGFQCPPGPGYWPIGAPEHPSVMGWRNPTHVIAHQAFPDEEPPPDAEVIVAHGHDEPADLWSAPPWQDNAHRIGELPLIAGDRYRLLALDAGPDSTEDTSAESYHLAYRLVRPNGSPAWVTAALPSTLETGSDGRPSAIRFAFLPAFTPPKNQEEWEVLGVTSPSR